MSETKELKYDVGYTYQAQLINEFGHVAVGVTGCRKVVETKIKEWIPLLMHGDTISFTRIEKE
jgi:hypothetical protein